MAIMSTLYYATAGAACTASASVVLICCVDLILSVDETKVNPIGQSSASRELNPTYFPTFHTAIKIVRFFVRTTMTKWSFL